MKTPSNGPYTTVDNCARCGEPTHPEDFTERPGGLDEWAGVCLLCFDAEVPA